MFEAQPGVNGMVVTMRLQIVTFASLTVAVCACAPASCAQQVLTGAGANFAGPVYTRWFEDYHAVDPSVSFKYQAVGSDGGQRLLLDGSADFAASNNPMDNRGLARASMRILHIPTLAGAVVLTYNLPGTERLRLDGPTIADIYLGRITHWNDPAIARLNAGVDLPSTDITVIHRSDSSGTSYIFTDYLRNVSPFWDLRVGRFMMPDWPAGLGVRGNDGIMTLLRQAAGSIGYLELSYAMEKSAPMAEVKNAEGEFVRPTVDSVTAAMERTAIPDDFRFSMVNARGKDSYPISGATWFLVYEQQGDPSRGKALVSFLSWMITQGQKEIRDLDYAPLSAEMQTRVLARIQAISTK